MPDIAAARPTAGGPVETSWGQQMHDAVEAMKWTLLDPFEQIVGGVVAADVPKKYQTIPGLAASTKKRWAQIYVSFGGGSTGPGSISVYSYNGTDIMFNAASTGVAGRYGSCCGWVRLGGTNNDQFQYAIDVADSTSNAYLRVLAIAEGVE